MNVQKLDKNEMRTFLKYQIPDIFVYDPRIWINISIAPGSFKNYDSFKEISTLDKGR